MFPALVWCNNVLMAIWYTEWVSDWNQFEVCKCAVPENTKATTECGKHSCAANTWVFSIDESRIDVKGMFPLSISNHTFIFLITIVI